MNQSEFTVFVRVCKQILWTMIIYTLLRFEFLIWNWSQWYTQYSSLTLAQAFFYGLRFDISAIVTISSVVIIAALLPWPFVPASLKDLTLRTTLFVLNLPFLITNMGDIEFLHFTGRRFTTDSLFLSREIPGKFWTLISSYWLLVTINMLILCFYFWILFKLLPKQNPLNHLQQQPLQSTSLRWNPWKKIATRILSSVFFLLIFVVGARGGIQLKPLEMAHAGRWNDIRLTHLITNSSFSLLHSIQKERIQMKTDFQQLKDYESFLNKQDVIEKKSISQFPWKEHPKNVVVFILESFSLEYMGLPNKDKGYTPFLDSLIPKSIYFPYAFANGRRSIEALPSLLIGIPSLMDEPFLTSQYQTTEVPLLGKTLKEKGIQSYFFHGGQNGTMFFDEFISRLQFDKYYGSKEFPDATQNDGTWGIWDKPFLQYMADELDHSSGPFLSVFFSLSSHHPFQLPAEYKDQFSEGPIPILKTIRYTDESLRLFFERAKKSPWYKDTVFIFTADHTSKTFRTTSNNQLSGFRVPLFIYNPKEEKYLEQSNPVQQIDVMPTLLELFQIEAPSSLLTQSLFSPNQKQVALYLDGDYWFLKDDFALFRDKNNSLQLYNFKKDNSLLKPLIESNHNQAPNLHQNNVQQKEQKQQLQANKNPNLLEDLDQRLSATIQYYNNGLLQNSLLTPDKSVLK